MPTESSPTVGQTSLATCDDCADDRERAEHLGLRLDDLPGASLHIAVGVLYGGWCCDHIDYTPEDEARAFSVLYQRTLRERDRVTGKLLRFESLGAVEVIAGPLRTALQKAERALYDARCGLDLGLGCARDLEGDDGRRATAPRSAMQEAHLERARAAHRAVRDALDGAA